MRQVERNDKLEREIKMRKSDIEQNKKKERLRERLRNRD